MTTTEKEPVYISHVRVQNLLGIDLLEFKAGRITKITGDNGVGKSSVMKAIQGAMSGGSMAKLIRQGEDNAEVVITFDDGTKLKAEVGSSTTRSVKGPDGFSLGTAASWVARNINAGSFNPIAWHDAKPKDRLEQVLEASDLELNFKDLIAACGPFPITELLAAKDGRVQEPLAAIDMSHKRVYEARADVTRDIKNKKSHIEELEQSLPATPANQAGGDTKTLRYELDMAKDGREKAKADIKQREAAAILAMETKAGTLEREAREEFAARLKKINDDKAEQLAKMTAHGTRLLEENNGKYAPIIERLTASIATAEVQEKQAIAAKLTRDSILKARSAVAAYGEDADRLSKALEDLDKLKLRVMERLPVEGLNIHDGELYYRQIKVDTLNTAELIDLSLKLAEATAGTLPIICLDGIERMGRKKREAFMARAAESKSQFFVTMVRDDMDLTITRCEPGQEAEQHEDAMALETA